MANKVSSNRKKLSASVLLLGVFLLLGCVWLLFCYRIPLIISGFNQWLKPYDVEIISIGEIRLDAGMLLVSNALMRHSRSQLTLSHMVINMNHGLVPSDISIDNLKLMIDYRSLLALQDNYLRRSDEANNDGLINWAHIPNVKLSRLSLELVGFPQRIVPPPLSYTNITDLKFSRDNIPALSMALFLGQQPVASRQLLDVAATFSDHDWQGNIVIKLTNGLPIINAVLAQPIDKIQLAGQLNLDFILSLKNNPRIELNVVTNNLKMAYHEINLIHSIEVSAASTLTLSDSPQLSPIAISVFQDSPLRVAKPYCLQLAHLLNKSAQPCEQLTDTDYVSILLNSELNFEVGLDINSLANWQLNAPAAWFKLETSSEHFSLLLDNIWLTADKFGSNFQLKGTSDRMTFAHSNTLLLQGKLTKSQDIAIRIEAARLMIQQLELAQQDIVIDKLEVSNAQVIEVTIVDGDIVDIVSVWSSNAQKIKYQDLVVNDVTGNHQARLSPNQLELQSKWRLGELTLASSDSIILNNHQVPMLSGQWQLPEQPMAYLLAIKNFLPFALSSNPQITNVIEYQGKISEGELQIEAQVAGMFKAKAGHYQDITLLALAGDWNCNLQYNQEMTVGCDLFGKLVELDVGFPVTKLKVQAALSLSQQKLKLELSEASGQLLGGIFSLQPFIITDFNNIKAQVELSHISLSQLVALQQKGIKVSGLLKGTLPIQYHNNKLTVTNGYMENHPPGGVINIRDNETLNQLRLSQPEVVSALNALEYLRYSHLVSHINYQADGTTLLSVNIRGRNPNIERPIELNYSHQENILQLMRSLRVGDEISKQIEKMTD